MRELLALPQAWMQEPALQSLFQLLPEARLVGGCVRDALLDLPIKDIDLAAPLLPTEIMDRLQKARVKALPTGIEHGTVTAVINHRSFEITSLRRDVEHDGRRAIVAFTNDWQEDAMRRDLTINALYASGDGEIFDYATGLEDLRKGRVRFMGNAAQRMKEDYLRILRFFRFHSSYALGALDREAAQAATVLASNLALLSAERVQSETLRLMLTPRVVETWQEMMALDIVGHFLPDATDITRLQQLILAEREGDQDPDPLRRLAALLKSNSGAKTAEQLKLSNEDKARLTALTAPDNIISTDSDIAIRIAIYRFGGRYVSDRVLLDRPVRWKSALMLAHQWHPPRLPVNGQDLMEAGVEEGPMLGQILKQIEEWWVSQDFQPDRKACLAYLRAFLNENISK